MKFDHTIRFRFSPEKALAAIHWMVGESGGIDLHTMLKSCYFADKAHLNEHGRPIFGAVYRAMKFGPVPVEIYEMAKSDPIWLAELGIEAFPWELKGYRLRQVDNQSPDLDVMSASDMKALRAAFEISAHMTFNARTAATHGSDWQRANLGTMSYEDMIEETPEKAEKVLSLRQLAPHIRM